jgi:hypothetical protein
MGSGRTFGPENQDSSTVAFYTALSYSKLYMIMTENYSR